MKKFLSLLLAAAMLCALLVVCGSKNDDSNGDYKPFVEVQGVSDDTILVGNTAATTGAYATVGVPFNAGMEAAFKAYNDAGGFQGKSIVLKHYDDGFDGAQGMTYTKQLVETDKVFAIVGHFGTNTVGATLDYLKEKGVPMVYAATGIDDLYQEGAKGNDAVIYSVQPMRRLTDSSESYDLRDRLDQVRCPTLVVSCQEDYLTPLKEQEYLAAHIKDCHHVILPNCGHASMYEQPALFASLIAGFAGLPQAKFDI